MKQSTVFLTDEGAAWLNRNINKINPKADPVLAAIDKYQLAPHDVLEIGCANGWRLWEMERLWGCNVRGTDPSIPVGLSDKLFKGTADKIRCQDNSFDTVIYGWSLYLVDPDDYFKIAYEGDRVLADGGYLIVYDFHAEHHYKTPYKHKNGLFSHHYDFSKLWLSHPAYSLHGRQVQNETSVTILRKDLKNAFQVQK